MSELTLQFSFEQFGSLSNCVDKFVDLFVSSFLPEIASISFSVVRILRVQLSKNVNCRFSRAAVLIGILTEILIEISLFALLFKTHDVHTFFQDVLKHECSAQINDAF